MVEKTPLEAKVVTANGAQIYCQVSGKGPAVLFIPGLGGDGGPFDVVANRLSDRYTTITYDRRGHSRSTPPFEWHKTSMTQQADDAAALLEQLGIETATVYGNGIGGLIALEMLIHHPDVITKAILHDPTIYNVLEDGPHQDVPKGAGDLLRSTFFTRGPQTTINLFLRWEYGPEALAATPGFILGRITNNGETFVMIDFPAFAFYKPDLKELEAVKTPAVVLASSATPSWRRVMCNWVGEHIHARVESFLGPHAPYFDHPLEMVAALQEYL